MKNFNMKNIFFAFFSILLISDFANAQEGSLSSSEKTKLQEKVQEYLGKSQPEFAGALPLLLQLHDNEPKDLALNYTLGYCLINLDDERALPYLEFCLKNPSDLPNQLYYYVARAYHLEMKFDEAIEFYEKYRVQIKKPSKHQKEIEEIWHEEKMCKNGIEMMKSPSDIEVFSISNAINSKFPEYGPIFNADNNMMLFTSCRPDTKGGGIDNYDGRFYEDIYMSKKDGEVWLKPDNIGEPINSDGNDAVVSMSPDGQKIYLYKFVDGHGDLYESKLKGDNWGEPKKLPAPINSDNWEPSMSITPDENTVFFASNRPGGLGGTDIYMVKKLPNGVWAQPQNLGEPINSKYDEDSPFILSDGKTLYFSSNSDRSMGGYDIFVSQLEEGNAWTTPENLGYPINTPHDDLYFSLSTDGKTMYLSSIHAEGKGDKDIYFAKIKSKSSNVMLVNGQVIDADTKKPIMAHIEVKDKITEEIVGIYNSNENTGNYSIIFQEGLEYELEISSDGYTSFIGDLKIPKLQDFQMITRNFKLVIESPPK